jgi:hypothetical protein
MAGKGVFVETFGAARLATFVRDHEFLWATQEDLISGETLRATN